jgi:YHS domain-containing protein
MDEPMKCPPFHGMRVHSETAAAKMEYQRKSYYSSSEGCHRQITQDPRRYAVQRGMA